jgi:hypothetical protein
MNYLVYERLRKEPESKSTIGLYLARVRTECITAVMLGL